MNIFKPCVVSLMLWTGVMGVFGQQALAKEYYQNITATDASAFTSIAIPITTGITLKQNRVVRGLIITNNDTASATVYFEKNNHQKTGNIIIPANSTLNIQLLVGLSFAVGDTMDVQLKGSSHANVDLTLDYKQL